MRDFIQGVEINSNDSDYESGLRAVVDYRGDVTIELVDGQTFEGYVFSLDKNFIHYFSKSGSRRDTIERDRILRIRITGNDTAAGQSWDDWVKRRDAERAKSQKKSQV